MSDLAVQCFLVEYMDDGYRLADGSFVAHVEDVPVGAIWDQPASYPKWEGQSLWLMTPHGPWHIDQNPNWWRRTGVAPNLTLSKGIWVQEWQMHAFLQAGRFSTCLCRSR